jgi:Flp pilus assembly pilin Flp
MRHVMLQLWRDDKGALIATEWVFIVTILVIGLVVGLKSVQSAVVNELEEIASAIGAVSQTYSYGGTSGCCSYTYGSTYTDQGANSYEVDSCTDASDTDTTSCAD